jgi:hypothetical protein
VGQLTADGAITGQPPTASDGFQSATFTARLKLSQTPKSYGGATGTLAMSLASPSAFVTLPISPMVQQGDTLYLRSSDNVDVRITTDDGAGGSVVATFPCIGLLVMEFQATKFLKLLEVQGTTTLEYAVTGPV